MGTGSDWRFDGRAVIVTGAGRGIGREHALLLASLGANVVVADVGAEVGGDGSSAAPADEVVEQILSAGGEAVACYASVAEEQEAASIVDMAMQTYGRLDAVVNNAGISDPAPFEKLSADDFRRMLDVHFFGTLFVTRAAWTLFTDAGRGRIVNTVSESMFGGVVEQSHYSAAKGAVLGLTRCLATEGEPLGIRVNAIAPRAYTRMSAGHSLASKPPEVIEQIKAMLAPGLNSPAAAYLAHEDCPLNGEILRCGMGSVARLAAVHTQGISEDPITVEHIAENIDAILDVTDATVTDSRPLGGEI